VMTVCVCLSVCLSVREHISGTTRPIFTNFFRMLPMSVVRSSSGGGAIRYGLPVVWMTSYLHVMTVCGGIDVTLKQPASLIVQPGG